MAILVSINEDADGLHFVLQNAFNFLYQMSTFEGDVTLIDKAYFSLFRKHI